ncbi:TPA: CDP-alcohol phosphatidyltransferase family protein [Candidatus Bathyarchaeota archaeon]|nr:CDP-alcohol phosphatidyltransferase family protein [Candidatus Bathyarchaeota archaeon]
MAGLTSVVEKTRLLHLGQLRGGFLLCLPSLITSTRLFITYNLVLVLSGGGWGVPIYALACLTDLFDGKVARLLHSETGFGAVFDASADFLLIFSTSAILSLRGLVSPWFLCLISYSFASFILSERKPVADPLGKHIGTVLFVAIGVVLVYPIQFVATWSTIVASSYIGASMALRYNKGGL